MSENENDFDALRRLLALKRHEIPPPGYFENFSDRVIARIRAGDTAAELPWLLRFIQWFERRPAMPVTFATSMCLVLLYGIVSVQQTPGIANAWGQPVQPGVGITSITPSLTGGADKGQIFGGGSDQTNNPAANDSAFFGSPASTSLYPQVSTGN